MKRRPRNSGKFLRTLTAFLILISGGAIFNVAVAWGLSVALWEPHIFYDGVNAGNNREVFAPAFQAHPGWPAAALTSVARMNESSFTAPYYLRAGKYSFAYRPIWPGFAINSLFYAAILWVVFFVPGKLRRTFRRRRGLCQACSYSIGTSPVCTECGASLPLPLRERAGVRVERTGSKEASKPA